MFRGPLPQSISWHLNVTYGVQTSVKSHDSALPSQRLSLRFRVGSLTSYHAKLSWHMLNVLVVAILNFMRAIVLPRLCCNCVGLIYLAASQYTFALSAKRLDFPVLHSNSTFH